MTGASRPLKPAPARLKIIATGTNGPPEELEALRQAGHEVIIGRPLDQPGRKAYTEPELIAACRDADVVLASNLERITGGVMGAAPRLSLVIVPFIARSSPWAAGSRPRT
jgi:hypothetical protein